MKFCYEDVYRIRARARTRDMTANANPRAPSSLGTRLIRPAGRTS